MLNLKKTLLAGAVLTALCASVFAAAPADGASSQPPMRERVNAILHGDDENRDRPAPPPKFHHAPRFAPEQRGEFAVCDENRDCIAPPPEFHRGPRLTPEQREEFAKRRAEWEKMTPEQRQEAKEKMRKEMQARHEEHAKQTMAKLTDEQKAEVEAFIKEDMAQREQRREKLRNMTPEQRDAIRANMPLPRKDMRGPRGGRHLRGDTATARPTRLRDNCDPAPHHGGPHHGGAPRDYAEAD